MQELRTAADERRAGLRQSIEEIEGRLAQGQVDDSVHFTFVCDESISMSGAPFKAVLGGLDTIVTERKQQAPHDSYSIVMFQSSARSVCTNRRMTEPVPAISQQSGGTDFNLAFKCVE